MATYKVLQDIEAEDKLLGPLTLRQFIYAGIAAVCLYLTYLVISKHAAFMAVVFLPPALVAGFFAFPWGRDQPTEIWALAKIRFMLKPHRRLWNQSGVKDLVTITAPKKIEATYTDGLSQTEVKSRLKALADTIDTRGWAIKNVNVNLYTQPLPGTVGAVNSDRLIDVSGLPQPVQNVDVRAADDILDEHSNPVAQHLDQMIHASNTAHRQQLTQQLQQETINDHVDSPSPAISPRPTPPNSYWFLNQPRAQSSKPTGYITTHPTIVAPGSRPSENTESAAEQAMAAQLRAHAQQPEMSYAHLRAIQPLEERKYVPVDRTSAESAHAPVTATPNPAIVELARDNDKDVATLARLSKQKQPPDSSPNEVVVPLHE